MSPYFLYSYAYARKSEGIRYVIERLSNSRLCVFIDSGAFTAYYSGAKISLQEYMNFLRPYDGKAWGYVQLDEIANWQATKANLRTMRAGGLRPVPVMTCDAPAEEITDLLGSDREGKVCAAGGVAVFPGKREWVRKRFFELYRASEGQARLHGLGFTLVPDIYQLPLWSVDCSSASMSGQGWGRIMTFDFDTGKKTSYAYAKLRTLPWADYPPPVREFLKHSGLTPAEWMNERVSASGSGSYASMMGIFCYMQFGAYCALLDEAWSGFGVVTPQRRFFNALVLPEQLVSAACSSWAAYDGGRWTNLRRAREKLFELKRKPMRQMVDIAVDMLEECCENMRTLPGQSRRLPQLAAGA